MSELLAVVAKITEANFIIISMLAAGLSLSLLMAVREEMGNRAIRHETIKSRQPLTAPNRW